ncbi:MAG: hypothetical protein ACREDZ_03640 [Kiloniellales bacterium]
MAGFGAWLARLRSRARVRGLVGRAIELSIAEPWKAQSPDGQGTLKGRIEAVGKSAKGRPLFLLEVAPFVIGGQTIRQVVASGSDQGHDTIRELLAGRGPGVDFAYRRAGAPLSPEDVTQRGAELGLRLGLSGTMTLRRKA